MVKTEPGGEGGDASGGAGGAGMKDVKKEGGEGGRAIQVCKGDGEGVMVENLATNRPGVWSHKVDKNLSLAAEEGEVEAKCIKNNAFYSENVF